MQAPIDEHVRPVPASSLSPGPVVGNHETGHHINAISQVLSYRPRLGLRFRPGLHHDSGLKRFAISRMWLLLIP